MKAGVKNHTNFFYFLIAFCISLFSVSVKIPITVSLTDITILFLLIYSILIRGKIAANKMSLVVFIFLLDLFLAGMINYYYYDYFSFTGFFSNFIRIIALSMIIIFIPPLLKIFDLKRFIKACLTVLKIHCILVILDIFIIYPWFFDESGIILNTRLEDIGRARGLFAEPSFFAVYAGLIFSLIFQYQINSKENLLKVTDFIIISLGLLASASLTGLGTLIIILFSFALFSNREDLNIFSYFKIFGGSFLLVFITILILGNPIAYLNERVTNLAALDDGSSTTRLVGSTILSYEIIKEKPLIGVGLGSKNVDSFIERSEGVVLLDFIETESSGESGIEVKIGSVTFWSSLLTGGGIPALLIFYFGVLGLLIFDKSSFFIGLMILWVSLTKGGVFDVYLWWLISCGAYFKYYLYKPQPKMNL
jgi:hypothetical protein